MVIASNTKLRIALDGDAGATREQTEGITQINTAVTRLDKVTQRNAASAEESAAAAEELNAQAEVMKQSFAELLEMVGGNSPGETVAKVIRPRPQLARHSQRPEIPMLPSQKHPGIVAWNEETRSTGVSTVDAQPRELIQRIIMLQQGIDAGESSRLGISKTFRLPERWINSRSRLPSGDFSGLYKLGKWLKLPQPR